MSDWTEERVERMRAMAANGYSASKIASALGGVSRNGVIGKMHRLRAETPVVATPAPPSAPLAPPAPVAGVAWLPAHYAQLRSLFAEGFRIKQIARGMRSTPGTIRKKIAMLGLVRGTVAIPSPAPVAREEPRFVSPAPAMPSSTALICRPIGIADLDDAKCKWPIGDPLQEGFGYCGAACHPSGSYCDFHADLATVPGFRRKRGPSGERLPAPARCAPLSRFTGSFT